MHNESIRKIGLALAIAPLGGLVSFGTFQLAEYTTKKLRRKKTVKQPASLDLYNEAVTNYNAMAVRVNMAILEAGIENVPALKELVHTLDQSEFDEAFNDIILKNW